MFCGVDQWTELFQKYREMKAQEKDPNRFKNNRGGALLKQQKEMAALKKRLPKLEQDLIGDIQEWEKEHERVFLVDGVGFVGYIESQWAALSENDQIEKAERCKKRKQQLAVDMVSFKYIQYSLQRTWLSMSDRFVSKFRSITLDMLHVTNLNTTYCNTFHMPVL